MKEGEIWEDTGRERGLGRKAFNEGRKTRDKKEYVSGLFA